MRRIPPESSVGLDHRNERSKIEFLEKVEQSGKWPQQACTTMFIVILEKFDRLRANVDSLVGKP